MDQTLRVNSRIRIWFPAVGTFNGEWSTVTILDIQENKNGRYYKVADSSGDWRWYDRQNLQAAIVGMHNSCLAYRGDNIPQARA